MSDDAITFEKIDVLRAPGFEADGFSVGDLTSGINVIYGPNASGKTTAARSIQSLLWPRRPKIGQAMLVGHLRAGEARWRVDLDRGRASFQRDGADVAEGPKVPPVDQRDRYYLCLRELLEDDNGSLAALIMKESAGGYDVSAARDELGYSLSTPRKNQATRDVEQAKKAMRAAENEQAKLRREEQKLSELRDELGRVEAAAKKTEVLRLAINFREAEATRRAAEERLQDFPDSMGDVRGDERAILDEQRELLRDARAAEARAQRTIDACEEELVASPLGDDKPPRELLETLDGYVSRLDGLQRDHDSLERELAEAKAARDEAGRVVGSAADPERAPMIDVESVHDVAEWVRQADRIRGEHTAYAKLEDLLGEAEAPAHLEQLRDGMRALHRWLSSEDPARDGATDDDSSGTARWVAVACAAVIAAASVALGVLIHLAWFALAAVAAALAWVFVLLKPSAATTDSRRVTYRRDFEKLDVPQPEAWSDEDVEGHLDRLAEAWTRGKVEAEKAREWESHASSRQDLEARADGLADERRELCEQLGLSFGQEAELYTLMSNLREWQKAHAAVASVEAQLDSVARQMEGLLGRSSARLNRYNFEAVSDPAQAKARVSALRTACDEVEELEAEIASAEDERDRARSRQEAAREAIEELFVRLGLEVGDDRGVAQRCEQKAEYDSAYETHIGAENTADNERRRLESHSEYAAEIIDRDVGQLRQDLAEQQQRVEAKDDLLKQIQDIETRIGEAKKSHEVEGKWADYEAKLERLNRDRQADYRKAAGAVLADYVQEQTRDRERPRVFHRARELFGEITHHNYRLDFHDGDEPEFRAWDTRREVGLSLDELSSGTRVQLLLAVRVAFVEHQEQGLKLPLVLDETLANSDDERARAIIEAMERIGADGRQIFYFTAQHDEVRKWRQLLRDSQVPSRFVDLGELTGASAGDEVFGEEIMPLDTGPVPAPGDMSHAEYGALLGVDHGLSPRMPLGQTHLWYLIEQPETLWGVLKAGVAHWGPLHALAEIDGLGAIGLTEDDYARIAARAKALDAQARAWAIGRGEPVTREALEASGAVSETFIERVSELCAELDGDAKALLAAIERGGVSRFRSDKRAELEEYLQIHGFIDPADPLSRQDVWQRVLSAVSVEIQHDIVEVDDIRRLLTRTVGAQAAPVDDAPAAAAKS